ncbi:hypothetical protein ISCGN_029696 [Ixodes scapularis]
MNWLPLDGARHQGTRLPLALVRRSSQKTPPEKSSSLRRSARSCPVVSKGCGGAGLAAESARANSEEGARPSSARRGHFTRARARPSAGETWPSTPLYAQTN